MLSLSALWDRTTAFIADHFAAVASVGALGLFLPSAALQSLMPYAGDHLWVVPILIVCGLTSAWAQLVLIALSIAPAAGKPAAMNLAVRRLPVQIGIGLLIGVAVGLAMLPLIVAIGVAAASSGTAPTPGQLPNLSAGVVVFLGLYLVVVAVVGLWLGARLSVLSGVILAERRGLGAIARTFRLTKAAAIRLIGLILLYVVVSQIASLAVSTVIGAIVGLFADPELARIVSKVFAAGVGAIFGTIAAIYIGQLYLALRDRTDGTLDLR